MNQDEGLVLKEKLFTACELSLSRRLQDVKTAINEAQEAANQETKSSAGDKHETGRAMMQLETEKLNRQLQEILNEQEALKMIRVNNLKTRVERGALVITNHLKLFVAISAGRLEVEEDTYFAISIKTPLGQALQGKKAGEVVTFQAKAHKILQIF